jgi:Dolichyl-phosphate-mannose-protein mannosyltransferase
LADTRRLAGQRQAPSSRLNEDKKRSGGSQATTKSAANGSWDMIARDSAESPQAGLVTMIRFPKSVPAQPYPAVEPPAPLASLRDQARRLTRAETERKERKIQNSYGFGHVPWLCLVVILTIQAVLSLRLVWSNTASLGEATYLLIGHAEIEHWLHGTVAPVYNAYFAGAPTIYPPIGAVVNSMGGLAGARILSLVFMLGTTFLLWCTTSRLFGRRAAVCGAALFAVLGPTLHLGAFATPDAMALFLLAASASCLVASRDRDDSALLLVGGTLLLVLANAVIYSTFLFDPTVVALAGLAVALDRGLKSGVARSGYVAAGVIGLTCALLALGNPLYLDDAVKNLSRSAGVSPALLVLTDLWKWDGLVCVIAAIGTIICIFQRQKPMQVVILVILVISDVLVPLTQVRLHAATSLFEHLDFGAWFAAAATGYALAKLSQVGSWKWLRITIAGLLLMAAAVPTGIMGRSQSLAIFETWPNSTGLVADLQSFTHQYPGRYLAEDYYVPAYYLETTIPWQRWSGTWYFSYIPAGATRPLTGLAAYRAAINRHYFSLVILDYIDTVQVDNKLTTDMQLTGNYQVVGVVPSSVGQYTIWAYEPPQQSAGGHGHR